MPSPGPFAIRQARRVGARDATSALSPAAHYLAKIQIPN